MAGADRDKALDAALLNIEKQFGKGSVMRLGDETRAPLEVIPTGSIALDVALGLGGLPRGRVVEIYGPESSGKTTVALHAVANAQRAGGIVAAGVPGRIEYWNVKALANRDAATTRSVSAKSSSVSPGKPTMMSVVIAACGMRSRTRSRMPRNRSER